MSARSGDGDQGGVAYVTVPPGEEVEHPALKPADAEPEPRGADEDPPVDPNDPASWPMFVGILKLEPVPRSPKVKAAPVHPTVMATCAISWTKKVL